ncbi:MAG: DUF3604 domain-containing protein [bacterium]|nr:DUF3604 domain-containing protein [bacterium]
MDRRSKGVLGLVVVVTLTACGAYEDPTLDEVYDAATAEPPPVRDTVRVDPNRNLLWGDLHIHTGLSYDAFTTGTRALPDDAYTYMKGGTIEHAAGYPIRAKRPLDFGAVTDHAEYLGVPWHLENGGQAETDAYRDAIRSGSRLRTTFNFLRVTFTKMASREIREETFGVPGMEAVSQAAWEQIIEAAERHDDPGRFTSFIAYEWSSMPAERNLHRNVIYAGSDVPDFPFSSRDSENPEDLWRALDAQRAEGMRMLAIPHNSNVSDGRMFESNTFEGEPLGAEYAETRMRNEPLVEIFQIKGSSETHPTLSPEDEFAGFELMDTVMSPESPPSEPKGSYARDALRTGLEFASREGWNPFRFGVIGSSDSHTASTNAEEDNYHGKMPIIDGIPAQRIGTAWAFGYERLPIRTYGAAGLVAAWAEANTRESIFAAMERKETFATSGPRMSVRFFAGYGYAEDALEGDWVAKADRGGVPMGGTLPARTDAAPVFLVAAWKDPLGANLDRVQIVKAWVDAAGASHERVFDVAASGDRLAQAAGGALAPVGDTVDVARASYGNTIGATELSARWQDPEHDPSRHAYYYARVIEIPTPRHTTYAAALLGVDAPEPARIQERAVTSAIWLQPTD